MLVSLLRDNCLTTCRHHYHCRRHWHRRQQVYQLYTHCQKFQIIEICTHTRVCVQYVQIASFKTVDKINGFINLSKWIVLINWVISLACVRRQNDHYEHTRTLLIFCSLSNNWSYMIYVARFGNSNCTSLLLSLLLLLLLFSVNKTEFRQNLNWLKLLD